MQIISVAKAEGNSGPETALPYLPVGASPVSHASPGRGWAPCQAGTVVLQGLLHEWPHGPDPAQWSLTHHWCSSQGLSGLLWGLLLLTG